MPKGLKIPVGVSTSGGLAFVSGDANDAKIIKLALGSGFNENAFQQDITLGEGMIFDIADEGTRKKIRRKIVDIFEDFERQRRFKLLVETIEWSESTGDQEQTLKFKYLNIESDEVREFDESFTGAA